MKFHVTDLALFEVYLRERKSLSDSSINVYVSAIGKFLLSNPEQENIEEYNNFIIKHAIKKKSLHFYSILKTFIEFKISDSTLKKKILENLIKPKENRNIVRNRRYLSEEQILEVVNNLDSEKHRVIALIQTLTGVRAGDVLRVKKEQVIPEEYKGKPVLRFNLKGKGNKLYTIFIHDDVIQQLVMDYISSNDGVGDYYFLEASKFKNRNKNLNNEFLLTRMNYGWYWADLKQALQTAGVSKTEFATHDFRRCFSRRVWEKYTDIYKLQKALNHSDPKTTMRYLEHSGLQNIDLHYDMQNN